MPELPQPKPRPHPWHTPSRLHQPDSDTRASIPTSGVYVDLHVTSNFTFLTGASHPDELAQQAAALGQRAIAVTDRNSLAGIVRAHVAAKDVGIQFIVGC